MLTAAPNQPSPRGDRRWGAETSHETGVRRRRPRVLIVDDDTDMLEMIGWCLRAAGWSVTLATNGADALLKAPALLPDAIVMDLRLPVVDGLEAIGRLKRDEETKRIPILAWTGVDCAASEQEARAAGCEWFVAKPCEPEILCAVLEALVTGRAS